MTYQLKNKIRQLRQEVKPQQKIGVSWKNEDNTVSYNGKTFSSLEELEKIIPKDDLVYVISFMNNATGKVFNHA